MCLLNFLSSNFNIVLSTKQATTNLVLVVDGREEPFQSSVDNAVVWR